MQQVTSLSFYTWVSIPTFILPHYGGLLELFSPISSNPCVSISLSSLVVCNSYYQIDKCLAIIIVLHSNPIVVRITHHPFGPIEICFTRALILQSPVSTLLPMTLMLVTHPMRFISTQLSRLFF